MQVVILNLHYDAGAATPEALLARYWLLTGWIDGLQQAGAQVTLIQRFHMDRIVGYNDVPCHFVADGYGPRLRLWQPSLPVMRCVRLLCATRQTMNEPILLHINGLLFPLQARLVRQSTPATSALVLQHHAEQPLTGLRRIVQRWGCGVADGFFFTNQTLAHPWLAAGIIRSKSQVYPVMEVSSQLAYQARPIARRQSGLTGDPVVLWTGNLLPNKDPLTVLRGFARVLAAQPDARLYMAYRRADLLPDIQHAIAAIPALTAAVTLVGEIPYHAIAAYYNSADFFVQGSAREGSGIALLDALACGVVPVVTDIPAFRTITDNGRLGALWPVGDDVAFAQALLHLFTQPLDARSTAARTYSVAHWSRAAVGRTAVAAYATILRQRAAQGQQGSWAA